MHPSVEGLIPHRGAMCLLDSVESWNEHTIVCRATSHRRPDHPLRCGADLYALCAIEYGSQAVAAHGSLLAGSVSAQDGRVLASVRDVVINVAVLDDLVEPLTVRAELVLAHDHGRIYDIAVTAGSTTVLTGRIVVMAHPLAKEASPGESRVWP